MGPNTQRSPDELPDGLNSRAGKFPRPLSFQAFLFRALWSSNWQSTGFETCIALSGPSGLIGSKTISIRTLYPYLFLISAEARFGRRSWMVIHGQPLSYTTVRNRPCCQWWLLMPATAGSYDSAKTPFNQAKARFDFTGQGLRHALGPLTATSGIVKPDCLWSTPVPVR